MNGDNSHIEVVSWILGGLAIIVGWFLALWRWSKSHVTWKAAHATFVKISEPDGTRIYAHREDFAELKRLNDEANKRHQEALDRHREVVERCDKWQKIAKDWIERV